MASQSTLLLLLSASVVAQERKEVAIVCAGHVRTYNLTASSWRRMLVRANPNMDFWLFALTYESGERKAALRNAVKAEPPLTQKVTADLLRDAYAPVVADRRRVVAKTIAESVAQRWLPARLRGKLTNRQGSQRQRISLMFLMISEAFAMVRKEERRRKRRYDVVLKARFDLEFLDPFRLGTPDATRLVVPLEMAAGPSLLSPKQIRTRPCDESGRLVPRWVQDHIAWGTSRSMELYCAGTARAVLAGTQKRQTRPELILAKALRDRHLAVQCDPSIRYTILR